jgi:hypothetical protein
MKVYRVRPDVKNFQTLFPEDESLLSDFSLILDCTPRLAEWKAFGLYCFNPMQKKGDFSYMLPGSFIVREGVMEGISTFTEMAGEQLPMSLQGETQYLINVTECVNSLDQDKTIFTTDPDSGIRLGSIEKYSFYPNRFSESSLFKIPETRRTDVLTLERSMDPEEEFKAYVEENKLSGLVFELLWES